MTEEIIIDGVDVAGCEHLYGDDSCDVLEFPSIYCAKNNCRYKEFKHLQRENKEKIDIIEQMIKILYPNANDDELYDVAFNGEYIDKLKELKDTTDTMLMANDIKKQDIDSLREANDRLEQENKELKEQLLEDKILDEHIESLSQEDNYRSALEEIREIAENLSPCKLDYSDVYCHQTDCTDCIQRIILKKINEVLNESK